MTRYLLITHALNDQADPEVTWVSGKNRNVRLNRSRRGGSGIIGTNISGSSLELMMLAFLTLAGISTGALTAVSSEEGGFAYA